MNHLFSKLLYLYALVIAFLFLGKHTCAQLPKPSEFCSHTKSTDRKVRQASFDYSKHDTYDVYFYYLNLQAETDDTFLNGFVEIQSEITSDVLDTVYLELNSSLQVDSVIYNGQNISFTHDSDHLLFFSPFAKAYKNELFTARVYYHGFANNSGKGRGYNSEDSGHGTRVNWTLSEPFYSLDWWPCKQDLEDKADSVWVFITTSDKNKVGSNGVLTSSIALTDGKTRYEWKSNYPIAYYLISISLAEYMEYSFFTPKLNNKQVWIQNYLYPDSSMYKSQKALIDCTKIQMNLLREKYGEYPFIEEKYGHSISRIGGGMEHQTMTTQVNFGFHLTIHEMGHSWFGNNVTCASWSDIWLNEGFATYTQYIGLENFANKATADGFMAAMQSVVMREPEGSVYVPKDELNNRDRIFSGRLSYYKGATIIHMIRYLLNNDDLFFYVLQEYQSRYAYQVATAEDFKQVLEELSGLSFTQFFDLWYYGEGYPIYNFEWEQGINNEFKLVMDQKPSTPNNPFFEMDYNLKIFFTNGSDTIIKIHQEQEEQSLFLALNKTVKAVVPNPNSWNLMSVKGVYSGLSLPGTVKVEPNPAHESVLIRFANVNPQRKILVYNSSLQFIEETLAFEKYNKIDISQYAAGVYFIQIQDGNTAVLKKMVKY